MTVRLDQTETLVFTGKAFLVVFSSSRTSDNNQSLIINLSLSLLGSISSTFYEQLLCVKILKGKKDSQVVSLFYAFGIFELLRQSCTKKLQSQTVIREKLQKALL